MFAIVLIIFILIEALFAAGTAMVLYHFYNFRVGRNHSILIFIFVIGAAVLFLAEFTIFASMDWEAITALLKSRIKTKY